MLPNVFIDSSVFFTAVNSPTGGSAKVFSLANEKFSLVTSKVVLAETERNVHQKLYPFHLERFFMLVQRVEVLSQEPDEQLIKKALDVIVEKDAVILAEARQASPDYLLTLDVKHFFTTKVEKFMSPTNIVIPKMLLDRI